MADAKALITGASGQDGWYLAHYLLAAGYEVHAQSRSTRGVDYPEGLIWHVGNVADVDFLTSLIREVRPTEIYNLAAISSPQQSWHLPFLTANVNALVPHQLCETIKELCPSTRLFQASSSEMFGAAGAEPLDEDSPLNPRSPYGISKAYAHQSVRAYRRQFGLHLSTGILFNHESPRRPLKFVSQKIAHAAALVSLGISTSSEFDARGEPLLSGGKVRLGSLETRRDFGFAGDYVAAMHAIVRQPEGHDFVVGSGVTHSIAEFCEAAFRVVGLDWREHVLTDDELIRKSDTHMNANPKKLFELLGRKFATSFEDLVRMMVHARIDALQHPIDA
jgi:GDPmannose 4,6-dehydratase